MSLVEPHSFFHNILGREEAEEKLIAHGVDKTYLARRSPQNPDCYILSYQLNGKFKHEIVNSKKLSNESISVVLTDMIQTNSSCEHAVVVALSTDGQGQQEVGEAGHVHPPQGGGEAEEIGVAGSSKKRSKKSKKIPVELQTDESHDRPTAMAATFLGIKCTAV